MKITNQNSNLFFHLFGWSIMAILFFVLFPMMYRISIPIEHYIYHLVLFIALIFIYYVNTIIILPKIIWQKNGVLYLIIFVFFIFGLIFFMNQIESFLQLNLKIHQRLHPTKNYNSNQNDFFISVYISIFSLLVFGVGIANHTIKKWNIDRTQKLELQIEKSKVELDSLKAQINPHFFFNTLNTIHSLTYFEVEKSRIAIQELAKMMRFVMNEEKVDKVPLNEEINFINSYIELVKFRINKNIDLKIDISIPENEEKIALMILLPFIENTFQHGLSVDKKCEIIIDIKLKGNDLFLKTKNEIFNQSRGCRKNGIGLENTLKRISILYKDKHEYFVNKDDTYYECFLKLNLA